VPDIFLALALGAIIVNDLAKKFFAYSFFDSGALFIKLAAPIIVFVVLLLVRLLLEIKEEIRPLHRLARDVVEVLPGSGSVPCSDLMRSRSQIDVLTLAGSVIIPLEEEHVVRALLDARRPSRVRCLMANPLSDAIITRYAHDEPVWKEAGTETIESRLIWLFNLIEGLDARARERLQVHVYSNYPMLSIFRADDSVYASYYAYKLRGDDTPMVRTDVSTYFGKSVIKHFEKLYQESPSLCRWMVEHYALLKKREQCRFGLRYSGIFLETQDGKLLLQKRDWKEGIAHPGQLSVFGGRSEDEESPRAAAVRELREETTLRVRESDLVPVATVPYLVNEGEERCMLCSYFVVSNIEPTAIKLAEGSGIELLSTDAALARDDLTAVPRQIIERRAQNGTWPSQ
jgi:8-oxo-dGTP pyrophosphatase MutT (NUDIX family)